MRSVCLIDEIYFFSIPLLLSLMTFFLLIKPLPQVGGFHQLIYVCFVKDAGPWAQESGTNQSADATEHVDVASACCIVKA